MNRMLSAQQIRGGRGLLGWSRRDLAIVSGISQGTIKAIEQGTTDARLSTLRKLAQTFTGHGVEFVATGPWTGVVIKNKAGVGQSKLRRSELIKSPGNAEVAEEGLHIDEIGENGDETLQAGVAFNGLALEFGRPEFARVKTGFVRGRGVAVIGVLMMLVRLAWS